MSTSVNFHSPSPRFSANSQQMLRDGLDYLEKYGYVVFSDVLNQDEIEKSHTLLWKYLDEASNGLVKKDDPDSWSNDWPTMGTHGVLNQKGIGQSELLWHVRSVRNVRKIYSQLLKTKSLIVSFDGCGIFRDWRYNSSWKTNGGWNHVDQNPKLKPGPLCFQGLVTMYDQNEQTGGLVVYPKTFQRFGELVDLVENDNDFVNVSDNHPIMEGGRTPGKLVHAKAGDLVIWDSRTIHCNAPATEIKPRNPEEPVGFLRFVVYVCMMSISNLEKYSIEEFRAKRQEYFEKRKTLSHWPTEFRTYAKLPFEPENLSLDMLNDYQKALLFGYEYNEDD